MESFEVLAAALAVGVVASLSAMVRRKAIREAERSAWRTASIALGLKPQRSAFAHLGVADTMEGTFDGLAVVVLRTLNDETGDGVLTVRAALEAPLRLGLRLSSVADSPDQATRAAPLLRGIDLPMPVIQAHDAERASTFVKKLRKKIVALCAEYDVDVDDQVVALSSRKVGRAVELRADLTALVAFRRAADAAARDLGESATEATIRASWEAIAAGKDCEVLPGPVLRGTLRKLPLTVTLVFDATSGSRSTEITLTCPLPEAAYFQSLPNLGEGTNALLAQLLGAAPVATQKNDAFDARFSVFGASTPTPVVKNAMLRLDPRVTGLTGKADGLKITATEALTGEDLLVVVEQVEHVAFVMMGQTSADGAYRTP